MESGSLPEDCDAACGLPIKTVLDMDFDAMKYNFIVVLWCKQCRKKNSDLIQFILYTENIQDFCFSISLRSKC